jgi:4-diphosphocytidyl-2-C-methyl-D-erythritol kinase
MKKLTAKSYTRVTFALDILEKIKEGKYANFHRLSTIKHKINLYDIISISESKEIKIQCSHPLVPNDSHNICWKVVELIKNNFNISQNVLIEINKNIPVMGGLAGGSANAATMFLLLNEFWGLNLTKEKMIELSRNIGMDVPFYFIGNTAFDTEAGELLEPIESSLSFNIVLAIPDFGISTKEAYKNIDYSKVGKNINKTLLMRNAFSENNFDEVIQLMHNDFEMFVLYQNDKLKRIKDMLLKAGCMNAILSGSGSCIFGIIESKKDYDKIKSKLNFNTLVVSSNV